MSIRIIDRVKILDLRLVAVASLVVGILFSLLLTCFVWSLLAREAKEDFAHHTSVQTEEIHETLQLYTEILYGLKGTFVASHEVTADEFHRHVALLRISQRYPGLQALGFTQRVPGELQPDAPAKARSFSATPSNPSNTSSVKPADRFMTRFIEPPGRNATMIGRDRGDRPKMRAAIERARDTGRVVATGPLDMKGKHGNTTLIMLHLPVYRGKAEPRTVAERRKTFLGVVTAIIRVHDLIDSALGPKRGSFGLTIEDLGPEGLSGTEATGKGARLLYRGRTSNPDLGADGETTPLSPGRFWRKNDRMEFGGRAWALSYIRPRGVKGGIALIFPGGTLLGGVLFFSLLFWFLRMEAQTQERLRLAANVFNNSIQAIAITDAKNRIVRVNRAFSEITGYSAEEVRGQDPRILKSERQEREFYQGMWSSILQTGQWVGELWNRRKDGVLYPGWMTISTVKNDKGEIANYVATFTDISKQKEIEGHLDFLAQHDPLTHLPNRLLFQDRFRQALAHARRNKEMLAVLVLDLDRFKKINDTLGHEAGDRLLKLTAGRLKSVLRQNDTVARLGGDEFLILLSQCHSGKDIALVAEKLMGELGSRPMLFDGTELHITCSIGISIYPDDGNDAEALIKNANAALTRSQEVGSNSFRFYTEDMNIRTIERLSLENRLRHAIEREELELYYQPRVDQRQGLPIGAEALVRWRHPELGLVPPGQFIPIAEESGLILPLGMWVLRRACLQCRHWRQEGRHPLPISVNVSALQLQRPDFVDRVREVLLQTGCDPRDLELELTESMLMKNPEEIIPKLKDLRNLGVHFAIDDFGTGYSSLSYLKRFPVDILKIDRSFVQNIPRAEEDMALVRAIIGLAASLHLGVVAEGVETREQLDFLGKEGCDWIQGYYFSKPLPLEEFDRYRDECCPSAAGAVDEKRVERR